jgi:hypothetical protein
LRTACGRRSVFEEFGDDLIVRGYHSRIWI